jgi:hypothetical protein
MKIELQPLRRVGPIFQELTAGSHRACNKMAIATVKKFGAQPGTWILTIDAAGVKVTAGWRIDGAGYITLQDLTFFF